MGQRDLSSLPCFGGAAVQISSKIGECCVAVEISSRMIKSQTATSYLFLLDWGVIHKKKNLVEKFVEKFVEIYYTRKMEILE